MLYENHESLSRRNRIVVRHVELSSQVRSCTRNLQNVIRDRRRHRRRRRRRRFAVVRIRVVTKAA